jgi:apolipoprotein D and lipocalin family protein
MNKLLASFLLSTYFFHSHLTLEAIEYPPFQTVSKVELNRYMGTWYEIARLDEPWDRGCYHNPMTIYTMKNDETIHIINQCDTNNFFQSILRAEGTATILDKQTNAKWKLDIPSSEHYKGLPNGEYWIIVLADDYSYAAISDPNQKHLWILSRTPSLPQETYKSILDKIVLMMPDLNILNVFRTLQDPLETRK